MVTFLRYCIATPVFALALLVWMIAKPIYEGSENLMEYLIWFVKGIPD